MQVLTEAAKISIIFWYYSHHLYKLKINYKWQYKLGRNLAKDVELDNIGATSKKKWGCSMLPDVQIHIVDMVLIVKLTCL